MFSSLFLIVSFLIIYTGIFYFPKNEKSQNGVHWLIISYIIHMCVRAVLVGITNIMFNVPVNLITIGITYIVIGFLLWTYIIVKREKQKYYWKSYDIATAIFLSICFGLVVLHIFSYNMRLVYTNSDPAVHFTKAMEIVRSQDVNSMYFNHLQNAIFIELFMPFLETIKLYKAFLLANSVSNLIIVVFFFVMISEYASDKVMKVIIPIITILFYAGYPLNTYMRYGFAYYGVGVLLIAFTMHMLKLSLQEENKKSRNILFFFFALGCVNVALCYMLLAPPTYLGVLIVFIVNWKQKHKDVSLKKLFVRLGIVVVTLGILLLLVMYQYFGGSVEYLMKALGTGGGTYIDLYGDFIFFIPVLIYVVGDKNYKAKLQVAFLFLCSFLICMLVEAILMCTSILSVYYFAKLYYPIWMIIFVLIVQVLSESKGQTRRLLLSYGSVFLLISIVSLLQWDEKIYINMGINVEVGVPIYSSNMERFYEDFESIKFPEERLELYEYVIEDMQEVESAILLLAESDAYNELRWYEGMTGQRAYFYQLEYVFDEVLNNMEKDGVEYAVLLMDKHFYLNNQVYFDSLDRVYENSIGCIVKMKY